MSDSETYEAHEDQHVHTVYSKIAKHFSSSRYKPWPVVEEFLKSQEQGSLGLDIGCGNGKYLGLESGKILICGNDRCPELIEIAVSRGFEGLVCDALSLPYRSSTFQFALSIAVIHHFSTPERRIKAISEIIRVLCPGGRALIFVWAMEQTSGSRRKTEFQQATSAGNELQQRSSHFTNQDIFVPWTLMPNFEGSREPGAASQNKVYQRYYHLFRKGELDSLVEASARRLDHDSCQIVCSGYDRDNHFVIIERTS